MTKTSPLKTELRSSLSHRRREKLKLTINNSHNNNNGALLSPDKKGRLRSIDCHELARRLKQSSNNNNTVVGRNNFYNKGSRQSSTSALVLDCRGYLTYSEAHILSAMHIACADRFNRKRVMNSTSVLDLVSNNGYNNGRKGKVRDIIVYDEGTSDLRAMDVFTPTGWQSPLSFVVSHLIQENRVPIYLNGE